ncbi:plasminogen-binding protein [Helicobacter sp. MIT 05-5293]|nr:hypothetical protein [Helicobacter sp. MIT 05-5293]TLD81774.1 plasminogen-binding protein [Helicobacter sp. MIT 05-5293]
MNRLIILRNVMVVSICIMIWGCSSKKHFEPPLVSGEMVFDGKLSSAIESTSREGAVLADQTLISFQEGITSLVLEKDYKFLSQDEHYFLFQKQCKDLLIVDANNKNIQTIPYDQCVLSARLQGDKIAMVLIDNTLVYYNVKDSQTIFSQKYAPVIAINSYLASPYISSEYIVYPDLEGKVLVYSIAQNKIIKDILVSSDKFFNNVIYLYTQNNYLVAATSKRVSVVIDNRSFKYDIDLRDVLFYKNNIYVLSIEGEIIEMDHTLNPLRRVKLPFAILSGIVIQDNKLYTLEKGGYVIELDLADFVPKVYRSKLKKHKGMFYNQDTIFYDRVFKRFQ